MSTHLRERFISGCRGNYQPVYVYRWWLLVGAGWYESLCMQLEAEVDRVRFGMSFPFNWLFFPAIWVWKFDLPFHDLEKVEFRNNLLCFVRKAPSKSKVYVYVRRPEEWLEFFRRAGVVVDTDPPPVRDSKRLFAAVIAVWVLMALTGLGIAYVMLRSRQPG